MFDNVGKKIMSVAKFFAGFGITISVLAGVGFMFLAGKLGFDNLGGFAAVLIGASIALGGFLSFWLGYMAYYAFGEMVDNCAKIAKSCASAANNCSAAAAYSKKMFELCEQEIVKDKAVKDAANVEANAE